MAPAAFASALAQLTGLDADTAREQLLPHLDSLQSQSEVRNYLDSLLAPGPAAQTFIDTYTRHRFPVSTGAATATASGSTSRASTPASSRAASPHPLVGAPAGARAYVKAREEGNSRSAGLGRGEGGGRVPLAGGVQVRHAPAPVPAPLQAAKGGKGKAKEVPHAEPELELSEGAARELLGIERALKGFDARVAEKAKRSCFCQARQHPLSPYVPICPACALVLCMLNSPALRCPSCSHFPLLSSASTASHIASLQSSREALLQREQRRAAVAKEQEARERAAIRFPSLGMDMEGIRRAAEQQSRSYAGHAGGGAGIGEQAERVFEARAAASARENKEKERVRAGQGGRVLRLDGKTGKVKVQTKVVRLAPKGKASVITEETTGVITPEEQDDGLVPFVDEDDDGVRGEASLRSRKSEALPCAPDRRVFVNVTLDEAERPVWIAEEVVEDDDEASAAVGAGASTFAAPPTRPSVPGAPAQEEEVKGRRRRGAKGGKGAIEAV